MAGGSQAGGSMDAHILALCGDSGLPRGEASEARRLQSVCQGRADHVARTDESMDGGSESQVAGYVAGSRSP